MNEYFVKYSYDENWCLVLGALQYALGRNSCVVEQTQDLIKTYWCVYDNALKERIIYFTQDFLKNDHNARIYYNYANWNEFLEWMKNNYLEEK